MAEPLLTLLADRVADAVRTAFGPEVAVPDAPVLPTKDPRHGDYSVPVAMSLAKVLGAPPPELAERLAAALRVDDVCEAPEVVRPGFVNLRLRPEWLAARLSAQVGDDRLGIEPTPSPVTVVVDYAGPNMAKEMHVGHLRSTIIGDALANVDAFLGNTVRRINHIGDYGTQFGLLVAHLEDTHPEALELGGDADLGDVVAFYREANARFTADDEFKERARRRVVDLQTKEPTARAAWAVLVGMSRRENERVYGLLGIEGLEEHGESSYEDELADVVADLDAAGLTVEDAGATCVFVPGFTNREGDPLPLIVRKADGGYNYATTDLAAVRRRVADIGARRILYVVAADQAQHLEMVFAVARMAGWVDDSVHIVHVPFGLVLGEGGKRLRTRSGDNVRLAELLGEAVERARAFLVDRAEERDQPLPDDIDVIGEVVGIGAVKYADLSQNRQSNYVFSFDKMLSLKGNTAPYLQYAYARIHSILREAGWTDGPPPGAELAIRLEAPQELELAKRLVEASDVVGRVRDDLAPNHLCAYLFDLSQAYNQLYEHCPVLRVEEPLRTSRLALCERTAATLRQGLALLGIEVLDRM
ncbi:MAG TPA: arginine--tRNA ligase [Acidimicrobiales bacterium]|nr:arginine--tRNA ligase [Acidimicrobiales bacterium]